MLVSAAVCPHPPALVPAVSQGASQVLAEVRDASRTAVRRLRAAKANLLVCVGGGLETSRWGAEAGGSLHEFGVDARFGGALPELPLSLTVGAYLLEEADGAGCDIYQAVASLASPQACQTVGAELAGLAERVALLVMGDGSARRSRQSPGPFDVRAESFDADVMRALTAPDPQALLAVDAGLAAELWVAGRPAWQVLAGALLASSSDWATDLVHVSAPLGVGYLVVSLESR